MNPDKSIRLIDHTATEAPRAHSIAKLGMRGAEDGTDDGFLFGRNVRGEVVTRSKGVFQFGEQRCFHGCGQAAQKRIVDHVAAAMAEEAGLEVEIAERCAARIRAAAFCEIHDEGGITSDAAWRKRGFIGKEEIADEGFGVLIERGFLGGGEFAAGCVEEGAGDVAALEDAVDEAGLVFVEEVRENIAGVDGVAFQGKAFAGIDGDFAEGIAGLRLADGVGPVVGEAMFAGEVPAAETFEEGDVMAGAIDAEGIEGTTAPAGDDGLDGEAGDVTSFGTGMAIHAAAGAFDVERSIRSGRPARNVEDVEHSAECGVDGDDFDFAAGNKAEVGVVVEVKCAGIRRGDEAQLQAGGGENEELRGGGDFERVEHAEEEGFFAGAIELDAAGGEVRLKFGEAVLGFAVVVAVRRGVEIEIAKEFEGIGGADAWTRHERDDDGDSQEHWGKTIGRNSGQTSAEVVIPAGVALFMAAGILRQMVHPRVLTGSCRSVIRMPSSLVEGIFQAIFEGIFELGAYYIGRVVVPVISFGRWKCDRLLAEGPKRRVRWGGFYHLRGGRVYLTAEATQFVGIVTVIIGVLGGILFWRNGW